MRKQLVHVTIVLLLLGCQKDAPVTSISASAKGYLNELLALMEQNSINRTSINWVDFKAEVLAQAGAAQTVSDTYGAIHYALIHLGDHHSFYVKAGGQGSIYNEAPPGCGGGIQTDVVPPDSIGYVRVPACSLTSRSSQATDFAQALQNKIKSQDRPYLKGWIVDLRGNTGGNMWPMLAGIGPLLGNKTVGYFIDSFGSSTSWSYQDGSSLYGGSPIDVVTSPYTIVNSNSKVAVLIDGLTGSSGEAIAVAFEGRPNTRFFGAPTCGLSTANQSYNLSDGAQLFLTISVDADRNGSKYGGQIKPDQPSDPSESVNALRWLLQK